MGSMVAHRGKKPSGIRGARATSLSFSLLLDQTNSQTASRIISELTSLPSPFPEIMTTATRVTRYGRESRSIQEDEQQQQHSRARWTNDLTKIVAELMVDEVQRGNRTRSSFKKQAWESITQQFHRKTGLKWDEQQLKSKYILMKKQYAVVKPLLYHSDFRFDESTGTVVAANNDAWADYLKEHPDAEQIKNNGCPFYNQLCLIFSSPVSSNGRHSQEESSFEHQHQPPDAVKEDEELSSASEETEDTGDQPYPNSTPIRPSPVGSRKRGRKGMDDAIAAGMQHMAAASRLYTTVATDVANKYSIADCIKALDGMQDVVDRAVYFAALDLFNCRNKREIFMSLTADRRLIWLQGKCSS